MVDEIKAEVPAMMRHLSDDVRGEILELLKGALLQDSIEVGSAGKSGIVKCYFNADKPEEAEARIKGAVALLVKHRDSVFKNGD